MIYRNINSNDRFKMIKIVRLKSAESVEDGSALP